MDARAEYRYTQIRPTRSMNSSINPTGSVEFLYTPQSTELVDWSGAFINIRLTATKAAWPLATYDSGYVSVSDGVCQNPVGALFTSASLYIGDTLVSRSDEFGHASTVMRLAFDSREGLEQSGSPIVPFDGAPAAYEVGASGVAAGDLSLNSSVVVTGTNMAIANASVAANIKRRSAVTPGLASNLAAGGTDLALELSMRLNSVLFAQLRGGVDGIPPGRMRLSLTLAGTETLNRLPFGLGATVTALTQTTWTDFVLYVPTYLNPVGIPAGLSYRTGYLEIESSTRQHVNDSSVQWTLPSGGTTTVLIAFGPGTDSPTTDVFSYQGAFYAATSITSLYISFGSRSYPNPQYEFANAVDRRRAYDDFRKITGALDIGSGGSSMSFREWVGSPVFAFSVEGEPGSSANILTVVSRGNMPADTRIHLTALYPRELSISADAGGQISSVSVSNVI